MWNVLNRLKVNFRSGLIFPPQQSLCACTVDALKFKHKEALKGSFWFSSQEIKEQKDREGLMMWTYSIYIYISHWNNCPLSYLTDCPHLHSTFELSLSHWPDWTRMFQCYCLQLNILVLFLHKVQFFSVVSCHGWTCLFFSFLSFQHKVKYTTANSTSLFWLCK